jgi:DNA (cytosine-5)-methyltransferase 1
MIFRVLDLFSGIGGFTVGLESTGRFRTFAFCEIDKFCRSVLKRHWPTIPVFDDVSNLHASHLGRFDLICAGFPCQDASNANAYGEGTEGQRTGLYKHAVRLAGEIGCPLLLENVPGLLARGFGHLLRELAQIGFDAEWDCFPTCLDLGHRRERLFIVAYPVRSGLSWRGDIRTDIPNARNVFERARFAQLFENAIPREKWGDRPLLGRGIHGIPARVDRIRALGNSLRPKVAQIFGEAMT